MTSLSDSAQTIFEVVVPVGSSVARVSSTTPPWGVPAREWADEAYFDESLVVAVSPDTVGLDPRDLVDETDPKRRMVYGDWAAPEDVTFRTAISTQLGLALENAPSQPGLTPIRTLGRLVRPVA